MSNITGSVQKLGGHEAPTKTENYQGAAASRLLCARHGSSAHMDKRVINGKDTRRRRSETLRRDLVERSLRTGASASALAQDHGINANLLLNWRRLHLQAQNLDTVVAAPAPMPTLLPVTVQPEMQPPTAQPPQPPAVVKAVVA